MKGTMLVEGDLVKVSDGPVEIPVAPIPPGTDPVAPPVVIPDPPLAPVRKPYFDIGNGEGIPGDIVDIVVEAGCVYQINGFHIGGGVGLLPNVERSGYGKFRAVGAKLGPFLTGYLEEFDGEHDEPFQKHNHCWSGFQFVDWEINGALPEEFWEFALGFFSIEQEVGGIPPISIPGGTNLFTVRIEILPETAEGQYVLTCQDEHYYTNQRQRRRDYLFTTDTDSPLASGGVTAIETFGGLLRVKA